MCAPGLHGHTLNAVAVDPRRAGRPHRFSYAKCVVGPRPTNSLNGVCRVDVVDGSVLTWHDSPSLLPAGPPTFVPRPGAADETDGIVLVDCLGADGRGVLVVLSGASFTEVARVVVPYRHTYSYRDTWVPA